MPPIAQSKNIELLKIERAAILLLYQNLNSEIDARAAGWAAEDATFFTAFGRPDPGVAVEHVTAANFYPGHIPSLIDAPVDRYPNVAAIASRADNQPSTDDHAEQYNVGLAVEIMCRAQGLADRPDQTQDALAAEAVNVRIKRTVEAACAVFRTDNGRSLARVVPKVGNTPNVITTDVFVRAEERGGGPRWFWQGARIDFRVLKWVPY